jgi:hypothetical protein
MKYYEIYTDRESEEVKRELRSTYKPLSQLVVPGNAEATMRGTRVLTVFHRFEPVVKIEGSEEEIDRLAAWFNR